MLAMRAAGIAAAMLLLQACAPMPKRTKNVADIYRLSAASGKGLLVGSASRTNTMGASSVSYTWRALNSDLIGKVEGEDGFMGLHSDMFFKYHEPTREGTKGAVFVIELPAGDYEFHDVGWQQGAWAHVYSTQDFSVKFRIEPGRITYLGEMNLHQGRCIRLRDQRERDLRMASGKFSALDLTQVIGEVSPRNLYGSCVLSVSNNPAPAR